MGDGSWTKPIAEGRDRLQSRGLVWVVVPLLGVEAFWWVMRDGASAVLVLAAVVSVSFSLLVRGLRAATAEGAGVGGLVCFLVMARAAGGGGGLGLGVNSTGASLAGLAPLVVLFGLTFAATRAGRGQKARRGLAEARTGRRAAQVVANLGFAGLLAWRGAELLLAGFGTRAAAVLLVAALAEATGDTVSSEIGQAYGGRPVMMTTLRRVERGTDGAVSVVGTAAGMVGAALVAGAGMWGMGLGGRGAALAFGAGVAGVLVDSWLGATVERRGWLGNDGVNFCSTASAGLVALVLLRVVG